ncbi:MAG: polyprenyl synthetase family protein [Clostridia bacterium]|nr:polyprenyl synthetase family protein [Clostridia bacterium]
MTPENRFEFYTQMLTEYFDCVITPIEGFHKEINDAMIYSLTAGGKRIRPMLCLEFCRALGGDVGAAMPFAAALEMIHTSSLIHDDLPCMDDDDLRRGKPTNHKVFGEAMAVLAGDALILKAFEYMTRSAEKIPAEHVVKAVRVLAEAVGSEGMVGGQVIDLKSEGIKIPIEKLDKLHKMKTGAMIKASVQLGCIAAGVTEGPLYDAATEYSGHIGLGFQIKDDILDVEGNTEKLGKAVGRDEKSNKSTYVTFYGVNGAKKKLVEITNKAKECLKDIPDNDFLQYLTDFLLNRDY